MKRLLLGCIASLAGVGLHAQLITSTPLFPIQTDSIELIYDATKGNAALANFKGTVYAHTGVITSKSTSNSDWKYVQGTWGQPTAKVKMTKLGNGKHSLKYRINTFYAVPVTETVLKLAFVFRDSVGNTVGRSTDGSDIYYDVWDGTSLVAKLQEPAASKIYNLGDSLRMSAISSLPATLTLKLNGATVASLTNATSISYKGIVSASGTEWAVMSATAGATTKKDSVSVTVNQAIVYQNPPANILDGITYTGDSSAILCLFAPRKKYIYLLGDFNNWTPDTKYFLRRSLDSTRWWIELKGLTPGKEYAFQYFIDGSLRLADAYCEKILDPWNDKFIPATTYPNLLPYPTGKTTGIVSVLQTKQAAFNWTDGGFVRPAKEKMVIYELLVRDFLADRTYKSLTDTLDYLQKLNINTIELMPIMEFDGNESWGYNPNFLFAADKAYGTEEALKMFINEAHKRGIAVILDMVLNQAWGLSPFVQMYFNSAANKPAADNPWLNADATHPFNVGYDFNHESPQTRALTKRVLRYWIEQYHFDGYRMDLSKGFTQKNTGSDVGAWSAYDASRVAIWKDYASNLFAFDSKAYLMLEHLGVNSEEKELSDNGMMFWGNLSYNYQEAGMGWVNTSDLAWMSYQQRGWGQPNLIGYMESHDEERLMYKCAQFGNSTNAAHNIKQTNTALKRMELLAVFGMSIPGPKLLWQFGELGYDISIDFNGRVGNKPVKWDFLTNPNRVALMRVYREIFKLKTTEAAFGTTDFTQNVGGGVGVKQIRLNHASMNVQICGNFEVNATNPTINFVQNGKWYEYFTGDSIVVSNNAAQFQLQPAEYRVYTTKRFSKPQITANDAPAPAITVVAYPNPFATALTIDYVLDNAAQVSLEIFDMTGKRVATPLQNEWQAAGAQTTTWNAESLPAGAYCYRLVAGNISQTGRVMLAK